MSSDVPRLSRPRWLRLPRRTTRLRLTALCGGLFLASGVALLGATYVLFERASVYKAPALPKIPDAVNFPSLGLLPSNSTVRLNLSATGLYQAQQGLANAQQELATAGPRPGAVALSGGPLVHLQSQLQAVQNQLTTDRRHLADAVHQLAQAGPAQAAQRATDLHQLLVTSAIALAIVAVLAVLAGWLVAGRMLRPIRTITRTARKISSTNLHERLSLEGPQDEMKELGDTLDDLFGRLDAAFDAQRHFVANASHELRTPLTVERTLLQVALDDPTTTAEAWRATAEEVLASNEEQALLIEALLALASSESHLDERDLLELSGIVDAALGAPRPEIEDLGLSVEASLSPAEIEGDRTLVQRLVANLLDNAAHHNVPGGRIEIRTTASGEGAVLSVSNTGPVIDAAEIERLFQPFQRLDARRSHHQHGYGLGLSIVRAVARAHHAELVASPRPGGGLSLEVVFPAPSKHAPAASRATLVSAIA